MEMTMSRTILAVALLIASASVSHAYTARNIDINSLSGKAMAEHPGVNGNSADAHFTTKPYESSLSGQVMRGLKANNVGSTATPTAKPDENSLSGKAMHDHPGNG
jgi:hypothetical protein